MCLVLGGGLANDNITGGTATVTHFIRDEADPDTETRIRSTELTGGALIFNLVQDNILDSTINFAVSSGVDPIATFNWDVPAGGLQDTVNVIEDFVNTRHYDSLRTEDPADTNLFTITPGEGGRARGGTWRIDTLTTARAPETVDSLVGGFSPATSFEAYDSTGVVTSTTTALGMRVNWRTAAFNNGGRIFTGARSFLQSHPSYSWTVSTSNVTNTNSCAINWQQSNFPNGTVTYSGAGQGSGNALPTTGTLSIGGAGNVTFTATGPFWNNESLGTDSVNATFVRPAAVTGAAQNQTINNQGANRTGQPTFYYPIFWFTSSDSVIDDADLVTMFTGGSTIQNTATSKTRTVGNLSTGTGDVPDLTNNSGELQYIWVAYPTGSPTIIRATVRTRRGTVDENNTLTLDPVQQSSTDLTFISSETGAPASASEDYKWFWIEVPNGTRITLGDTSK